MVYLVSRKMLEFRMFTSNDGQLVRSEGRQPRAREPLFPGDFVHDLPHYVRVVPVQREDGIREPSKLGIDEY